MAIYLKHSRHVRASISVLSQITYFLPDHEEEAKRKGNTFGSLYIFVCYTVAPNALNQFY